MCVHIKYAHTIIELNCTHIMFVVSTIAVIVWLCVILSPTAASSPLYIVDNVATSRLGVSVSGY